eukprot:4406805-Amphidinium_carterae.2
MAKGKFEDCITKESWESFEIADYSRSGKTPTNNPRPTHPTIRANSHTQLNFCNWLVSRERFGKKGSLSNVAG